MLQDTKPSSVCGSIIDRNGADIELPILVQCLIEFKRIKKKNSNYLQRENQQDQQ